jgi:hypothetical protein
MTSLEVSFATLSATLGTKLDGVAAAVDSLATAVSTQHGDHEGRMRLLEGRPAPDKDLSDHEARLRVLEARPIDPSIPGRVRALERFRWLVTGAAAAGGGVVGGIVTAILGG